MTDKVKHIWQPIYGNQNKAKKLSYTCLKCHAVYVLKPNDILDDSGIGCFENISSLGEENDLELYSFTGVHISSNIIFYENNGRTSRKDGPALIYPDGTKIYYMNGELHREDGPAKILADGTKFYFLNGEYVDVNSDEELAIKILLE